MEYRDEKTLSWLRKGDLKTATEGIIMAAQEQAIRTRSIKHHIDKEHLALVHCTATWRTR